MKNKKWIRVEEGPENSVIYYDEDGNSLKRFWKAYEGQPVNEASTRSWRNNNPGNHCYDRTPVCWCVSTPDTPVCWCVYSFNQTA